MEDAEKQIIDIVKECMPFSGAEVRASSVLSRDLGFCSYDMMVLIAMLDRNGIEADVSGLSEGATVKDLFDAAKKRIE